jgi:hypothetical protein
LTLARRVSFFLVSERRADKVLVLTSVSFIRTPSKSGTGAFVKFF